MVKIKLRIIDSNTEKDIINETFYTQKDIKNYNLRNCRNIDTMNEIINHYHNANARGEGRYIVRILDCDK
jgi:hypothetical protein